MKSNKPRRSLSEIKASVQNKRQNAKHSIPSDDYCEHINREYKDMEPFVYQSMNSEENDPK